MIIRDIIKVNLGFNIGSELGGLHYCVVIETKKLTENNATSDEIYLKTTELNNNITEAYKN